jgi:hypothetical protein
MRTSSLSSALLLSCTLVIALLAASPAVDAADHTSDQVVAADPRGIVEVSNVSGKIEVSGWDQPQVSVHAELSGRAANVDVTSDHGRTTITVRSRGLEGFSFGGGGGDADLKIKIPRGSELDASGVSADVISTDVLGVQRLKSVSGSIKADIAQADVEAKTVSGSVILHGHGKPAELHITTISGSVHLDHGAGDMEVTTTSGDLDVQLDPGRSVRAHTISGRMVIQGKLAKDADVDGQTVSGEVKLHMSAEEGYQYEVSSFSGTIRNCFNAESERTSRYGPGERLSGTRGAGRAHVRLKTMSGDVDLCDKP